MIILLSLLIGMGITKLSSSGADRFNAESCVNTFYAPLASWGYYAASSKMLSGEITPSLYRIQRMVNSGFMLRYEVDDQDFLFQEVLLSEIPLCQKGKRYQVALSSDFDEIEMLPSLRSYGYEQGFRILGNQASQATGTITLKFCSPSSEVVCEDF